VSVHARTELPATVAFWTRGGFGLLSDDGVHLTLGRELPVACEVVDAEAMRELGRRVAASLRAGDLVLLTGELGAGKTTFAQGIGAGLGVRGDVTSPTFVIARVHRAQSGGPALVHVDAYRLGGVPELDDLDLDASLEDSVTLVEWGEGLAEGLAEDRLEVAITRTSGEGGEDGADEVRTVRLTPIGARWVGSDVADLVG
jgi:tRNA threonylcarbamoyladenosine biosynthesis protein TsaE